MSHVSSRRVSPLSQSEASNKSGSVVARVEAIERPGGPPSSSAASIKPGYVASRVQAFERSKTWLDATAQADSSRRTRSNTAPSLRERMSTFIEHPRAVSEAISEQSNGTVINRVASFERRGQRASLPYGTKPYEWLANPKGIAEKFRHDHRALSSIHVPHSSHYNNCMLGKPFDGFSYRQIPSDVRTGMRFSHFPPLNGAIKDRVRLLESQFGGAAKKRVWTRVEESRPLVPPKRQQRQAVRPAPPAGPSGGRCPSVAAPVTSSAPGTTPAPPPSTTRERVDGFLRSSLVARDELKTPVVRAACQAACCSQTTSLMCLRCYHWLCNACQDRLAVADGSVGHPSIGLDTPAAPTPLVSKAALAKPTFAQRLGVFEPDFLGRKRGLGEATRPTEGPRFGPSSGPAARASDVGTASEVSLRAHLTSASQTPSKASAPREPSGGFWRFPRMIQREKCLGGRSSPSAVLAKASEGRPDQSDAATDGAVDESLAIEPAHAHCLANLRRTVSLHAAQTGTRLAISCPTCGLDFLLGLARPAGSPRATPASPSNAAGIKLEAWTLPPGVDGELADPGEGVQQLVVMVKMGGQQRLVHVASITSG
ncbi:MAG: hypothetical protein M1838_000106 [Thelocarpon superellum]|nr:MAG: hypothetical protein M1838_000106 [Thelocarpon superellum]